MSPRQASSKFLPPAFAFRVARSPCMLFLVAFGGAIWGSMVGGYMGQQAAHSYSLAATTDMKGHGASDVDRDACPEWTLSVLTQRQVQRDYCIRHFNSEAPRQDLVKAKLRAPNQTEMDFVIYGGNDIVSSAIQASGHWEPHLSEALVTALTKVAEDRGLPRELVHLLDIGGNLGAHTVYVQAAGFSAVIFEPLPQNEAVIRTNLCFNDPEQERVTLFSKGLGSKPMLCRQYSAPTYNRGNGVVSCDGTAPKHIDGELTYRGQMEIVRLDDLLLPCKDGTQMPPGIVFGAMKMDVEGFEPHVLQGGERFLTQARIPFIVFEIGRIPEERRKAVLKFFYDLGYLASTQGFFQGLGRPDDLPNVENVHLVLQEAKKEA